jgi:hypothetical protein
VFEKISFGAKLIHTDGEKEFRTSTVKMDVFLELKSLVLFVNSF